MSRYYVFHSPTDYSGIASKKIAFQLIKVINGKQSMVFQHIPDDKDPWKCWMILNDKSCQLDENGFKIEYTKDQIDSFLKKYFNE